jgi:hypothetical protein
VFWLTPDGKHGLVAATRDQAALSGSGSFVLEYLATSSYNHVGIGQNFIDWRLPTIAELKEMYNKRSEIGGFRNMEWYWSSTEYDSNHAYYIDFRHGYDSYHIIDTGNVRAVRAF